MHVRQSHEMIGRRWYWAGFAEQSAVYCANLLLIHMMLLVWRDLITCMVMCFAYYRWLSMRAEWFCVREISIMMTILESAVCVPTDASVLVIIVQNHAEVWHATPFAFILWFLCSVCVVYGSVWFFVCSDVWLVGKLFFSTLKLLGFIGSQVPGSGYLTLSPLSSHSVGSPDQKLPHTTLLLKVFFSKFARLHISCFVRKM